MLSRSSSVQPNIFSIVVGVDSGLTLKLFSISLRNHISIFDNSAISSIGQFLLIASKIANILLGRGILISCCSWCLSRFINLLSIFLIPVLPISKDLIAFVRLSVNVEAIDITSPTLCIDVPKISSVEGNLGKSNLGIFTTT